MANHLRPMWRLRNVLGREVVIAFPSQLVNPEYETRLAPIRGLVWCVVFEVGLSIAIVLVWRLW